jgi:hypothetical protein
MTPRNIFPESPELSNWISKQLLSQASTKQFQFNVSGEGPSCAITHPALLKIYYLYQNSPEVLVFNAKWQDWSITSINKETVIQPPFIHLPQFGGWPKDIFNFLKISPQEAVLHFEELGPVHLSRSLSPQSKEEASTLQDFLIPVWLDYALSPELWGQSGKWTRFHEQFHTLFEKFGLLIEEDSPGYYPLEPRASFLEEEGFLGRKTENAFLFIPGWDFPLSGLKKLEEVLSRRHTCSF